ncbi:MAG: universal stress protein [Gammaproteobacteria bacterium]|nr:universal stress protein [Gammaproteobacteria bacterium]
MFKSIVVAFDGSPHSSKALEVAAVMAAEQNAKLGIAYVIDVSHMNVPDEVREMGEIEHIIDPKPSMPVDFGRAPTSTLSSMADLSAQSDRALFQYSEFLLEQAENSARHCGATQIDSRALQGDAAEEIVAYARDQSADLIVCGNRGFGKLKTLLLGSTSHKIAQMAECSCMTVK